MKRIADEPAPTRGRVELVTGPDDRALLTQPFDSRGVDNEVRAIEYMNTQWHAMAVSPIPPTGIRVVDPLEHEVILSRGPIDIGLVEGGFRRNGRVVVDNPKCAPCIEGEHRKKPKWHTWADVETAQANPAIVVTQRCSCECAGPRDLTLRTKED